MIETTEYRFSVVNDNNDELTFIRNFQDDEQAKSYAVRLINKYNAKEVEIFYVVKELFYLETLKE